MPFSIFLAPFLISGLAPQIDIPDIKKSLINVCIGSSACDRDFILVHGKYMSDWLAAFNARSEQVIHVFEFFAGKVNPFSRLGAELYSLFICYLRIIKIPVILTITTVLTGITDIGRPIVIKAFFSFVFGTEVMTVLGTGIAIHWTILITTDMPLITTLCVTAIISSKVTSSHENAVFFDLFGY